MDERVELKISQYDLEGVATLNVGGRIDATTLYELKNVVNDVLKQEKKAILFNMADVDYLSSAGLRVLLTSYHHMMKNGGKMAICSMSPPVFSVIKLAAFDQFIKIFDSEEEALQFLKE